MAHRFAPVLLAVAVVAACDSSPLGTTTCTSNEDCSGGEICDEGSCLRLCAGDPDCDTGSACLDGVCVPGATRPDCGACRGDADCLDGSICALLGDGRRVCVPLCAPDDTCPGGFACLGGACLPP